MRDSTILSRTWLIIISFLANSSSILTGTATLFAYAVPTSYLPSITYSGVVYYPGQILVALWPYFAVIWVVSQILDALTDQPAAWLNRFGFLTSLYALGAITASLIVAFIRETNGTIPDIDHVLRSAYAMSGLIIMFVLSLLDITVLQHIKNKSVREHEARELAHRDDVYDAPRGEVVQDGPYSTRGGPIIGTVRIERATIMNIDCRGRDVTFIPATREGELPQVRFAEPVHTEPGAAAA